MANPVNDTMTQLQTFKSALSTFASSSSNFRILATITPPSTSPSSTSTPKPTTPATNSPPQILYVLDSSFNPPTRAHLNIATSALVSNPAPSRLLLLLATQNADKAPKPAPFEHRLTLMHIFAKDLTSSLNPNIPPPTIDIGVTKLPYFVDKARVIDEDEVYKNGVEQIHCTGFDTLIRILDPKYYPPEHTLDSLQPFLERHRLRVTYRLGDGWGNREEQDGYLRELREGRREDVGGRREWAERIEFVVGEGQGVSSTRVREAVKAGDEGELAELLTEGVRKWVVEEKLYTED